jgi:hypothetical protein
MVLLDGILSNLEETGIIRGAEKALLAQTPLLCAEEFSMVRGTGFASEA